MAIIGFVGTPGSGKTYEAVKKVIDNLRDGRIIYTNIRGMDNDLCKEMIKGVTGLSDLAMSCQLHMLQDQEVEEFWMHIQPGCLVVIDEVQNVFGSREWMSDKNKAFGQWASVHRHYGYEVVLITQNIERIDTSVRSLIEWTYNFRKINYLGNMIQAKYQCFGYGGCDTKGTPLSKTVRTYNKKIFLCYKSYVSEDVKEMGIMKHANILKHPIFFIIPIVLCFTLYMIFGKSSIGKGDLFGTKDLIATQAKPDRKKVPKNMQSRSQYFTTSIQKTTLGNTVKYSNRFANKPNSGGLK